MGSLKLLLGLIVVAVMAGIALGSSARAAPEDATHREGVPDGEAERSPAAPSAPILAISAAGPRLVAVGDRGHVLLSDDEGETWRQARAVPTRALLVAVAFSDARRGVAVGQGGVILRTVDGGDTWALQRPRDADSVLFAVAFVDARHGWAVGAFGLAFETTDGGVNWSRREILPPDYADAHLNGIYRAWDGALVVVSEQGIILRSNVDASAWEQGSVDYEGSLWGGLSNADGSELVFGLRGSVRRRDEHGRWTAVTSGTPESLSAGYAGADGLVVLAGLNGAVVVSRDHGRTFEALPSFAAAHLNAVRPAGKGWIFGGAGGVSRQTLATVPVGAPSLVR